AIVSRRRTSPTRRCSSSRARRWTNSRRFSASDRFMTSSADSSAGSSADSSAGSPATPLADFLAWTLAGAPPATPAEARGECAAGVRWQWHDEGVLELEPAHVDKTTRSVLLSAGVHGDETAPIELLSQLVADIAAGRAKLACRLLAVLGNAGAMR